MKKVINAAAGTVTFTFEGGLAPVILDTAQVSDANRDYAMMHGFAARIGDNAAIQKSAENNFTVTEGMRQAAVLELVNHYHDTNQTEWNIKAAARKAPVNPVIAAIAAKLGVTYEEAQAKVAEQFLADLA